MGLVSVTAHVAGTVLTAAALNNNDNAFLNQINGNLGTVNFSALSVTSAILASSSVTTSKLDVGVLLGLATVTGAPTDFVAISDTSDSGKAKKCLVSDLSPAAASQAEQEAGSSTAVMVTPGRQQFHPSAAKAWASFDSSPGTPTIAASYNVTSLTDNGVGDITVNWTTAFSSANYVVVGNADAATAGHLQISNYATGSTQVVQRTTTTNAAVDGKFYIAAFGDQ